MSKQIVHVCSECGSENVRRDAWAEWCTDKQEWVLDRTFDAEYCIECEGTTLETDTL